MPDNRSYADRKEYLRKAVTKRRKKLRLMAREYKGGKCMICNYDRCLEALDFHHLDPSKKGFGLSEKGITRSWEKIRVEIDKCILICANCHREIHAGITQLPVEIQVENEVNCWKPQRGNSAGNQQPSRYDVSEGSETIPSGVRFARTGNASHPHPNRKDGDIVHPFK